MSLLPPRFKEYLARPRFWTDLLGVTEPKAISSSRDGEEVYSALRDQPIVVPIGELFALSVQFRDLPEFELMSIGERRDGKTKWYCVASDDQAHAFPHVLRWDELDLLGRYCWLRDPELPHPGWIVALLARNAPVFSNEDAEIAFPLLREALASLECMDDAQMERQLLSYDWRQGRIFWRHDEKHGWWLEQDDEDRTKTGFFLYSYRELYEPIGFPFDLWNRAFASIEHEVNKGGQHTGDLPRVDDGAFPCRAAVRHELIDQKPRNEIVRDLARDWQWPLRTRYRICIEMEKAGKSRDLKDDDVGRLERELRLQLESAPFDGFFGEACNNTDWVGMLIEIHDKLDAAINVIYSILQSYGAGPNTVVRLLNFDRRRFPWPVD